MLWIQISRCHCFKYIDNRYVAGSARVCFRYQESCKPGTVYSLALIFQDISKGNS
jgi:hypothetical protein